MPDMDVMGPLGPSSLTGYFEFESYVDKFFIDNILPISGFILYECKLADKNIGSQF